MRDRIGVASVNTWGLSSQSFLLSYAALLVAVCGLVLLFRWRISEGAEMSSLTALGSPELGPYEVAMLKGGGYLALTTAVCRLREAGVIQPDASGKGLVAAGSLPTNSEPIEAWVFATVRDREEMSSSVLNEVAAERVLAPIRERLKALGLLLTDRQAVLIRRQLWWFAPLLLLGAARLVAGVSNHRPVGYLVLLMGVAVYLAYVLPGASRATRSGRRLLKGLESDSSALGPFGFAGEVAITGMPAVWAADAALASAIGLTQRSGFFAGGGGCGGGGGGCGGGGGGGCGGCGG